MSQTFAQLINGKSATVEFSTGSASTPSVAFSGDTNTGIYSPGADQVAISTNGTGRLFVNNAGQVGLGVSSPQSLLHIDGDATAFRISRGSAIGFAYNTGTAATDPFRIQSNGGSVDLLSASGQPITLSAGGSEKVRVTSAGLVGVGTSSPATLLEVRSATTNAARLRVTGTGTTAGNFRGYEFGNGSVFKGGLLQDESTDLISIFTPVGGQSVNITSAGSVGIGTTSPGNLLTVSTNTDGTTSLLKLHADADGVNNGLAGIKLSGNAGDHAAYIYGGHSTSGNTFLSFYTDLYAGSHNPQEKMRLDANGRLLVGTSSSGSNSTIVLQGSSVSSANESILRMANGSATPASGVDLGAIIFSDNTHTNTAIIEAARDGGTWSGSSKPTRLLFSVTADGASSPTERMRIDNVGNLIINGSAATVNNSNSLVFLPGGFSVTNHINGTASGSYYAAFGYNGTTIGTITQNGTTAVAYNTSSDYRLKENVEPVTDGIARLQQLKPSRFNFIADPDKTVDGFLAHEVQAVVPEAITGEKDAEDEDGKPIYQGIDQSKLVPLLTAALQEAVAKIESLEARLTAAGI